MRNMRSLFGGLLAGVFAAALVSLLTLPVLAQQPLRNFSPRIFQTQQTHYLRFVVNFNSCVIPAGSAVCGVRVGALPYNSFLTAIHKQILTTFNPTTSATVGLSTSATGAALMAAFNVFTGQATTAVLDTGFTAAGELVTGNNATQLGADGGFDVYAVYTTGANGSQGTQGAVVFILEYIAPNDGSCTAVAMGATAAGC